MLNQYYKSLFPLCNTYTFRKFNNCDVGIQTDAIQTDEVQNKEVQTDNLQTDDLQTDDLQTDEILKDEVQINDIQTELSEEVSYNNLPIIIGITGKKFNGKDTLGNYLSKYGYKRLAFADPLKEVLRTVFHFNDEQLYGEDKEKPDPYWKIPPRSIMQFVGTDLFRHQISKILPNIGNNIWIEVVKRQIVELWKTNPKQKIVLTDLRFPNEINLIKELNGTIIRVKRNIDKNDNDFVVVHESETYIDKLDVEHDFENNGTKAELFKKFDDLYNL